MHREKNKIHRLKKLNITIDHGVAGKDKPA